MEQEKTFKQLLWHNAKMMLLFMLASGFAIGLTFGLAWLFIPYLGTYGGIAAAMAVCAVVAVCFLTYMEWRQRQAIKQRETEEARRRDYLHQLDQQRLKDNGLSLPNGRSPELDEVLKDIRRLISDI